MSLTRTTSGSQLAEISKSANKRRQRAECKKRNTSHRKYLIAEGKRIFARLSEQQFLKWGKEGFGGVHFVQDFGTFGIDQLEDAATLDGGLALIVQRANFNLGGGLQASRKWCEERDLKFQAGASFCDNRFVLVVAISWGEGRTKPVKLG